MNEWWGDEGKLTTTDLEIHIRFFTFEKNTQDGQV